MPKRKRKNKGQHWRSDGLTDEYKEYIHSTAWKKKREQALELAGYKCSKCPKTHRLQVHHLTYDRLFNEEVEDLQVLCFDCHSRLHPNRFAKKKSKAKKGHYREQDGHWTSSLTKYQYGVYLQSCVWRDSEIMRRGEANPFDPIIAELKKPYTKDQRRVFFDLRPLDILPTEFEAGAKSLDREFDSLCNSS